MICGIVNSVEGILALSVKFLIDGGSIREGVVLSGLWSWQWDIVCHVFGDGHVVRCLVLGWDCVDHSTICA